MFFSGISLRLNRSYTRWLMVPRGCAILYVPRRNQHLMKTAYPTDGRFLPEADREEIPPVQYFGHLFEQVSTIDTSPYLCILEALKFRKEICGGEEQVRAYCIGLAKEGGDLMAHLMSTEVLKNTTGTLQECCFTNVKLPLDIDQEASGTGESGGIVDGNAQAVAIWMTEKSVHEFDTYIAVRYYAGAFWTRLSGQIYLDLSDFAWAAGVLLELCARAQRGEWKGAADDASVSQFVYR